MRSILWPLTRIVSATVGLRATRVWAGSEQGVPSSAVLDQKSEVGSANATCAKPEAPAPQLVGLKVFQPPPKPPSPKEAPPPPPPARGLLVVDGGMAPGLPPDT